MIKLIIKQNKEKTFDLIECDMIDCDIAPNQKDLKQKNSETKKEDKIIFTGDLLTVAKFLELKNQNIITYE